MNCKCDILEEFNEVFKTAEIVVNKYIEYFRNELGESEIQKDGKHYGFIPTEGLYYLHAFKQLYNVLKAKKLKRTQRTWLEKDEEPRFLDAGCGIGNILLAASACGFGVAGIELDRKTYEIAKRLTRPDLRFYNRGPTRIFRDDILRFNKYNQYDVIYFYQPMSSDALMDKFVWKLAEDVKVGAFIIPNGPYEPFCASGLFKDVSTEFNMSCSYDKVRVFRKMRQKKRAD